MPFDVLNRLGQCVLKLLEILFIQEDLVLLVFFFTDTLAFRDGDVEVFFRFCGLDVEEIRPFASTYALREYLVLIVVFQRTSLPIR